jgi:hypothetical protein
VDTIDDNDLERQGEDKIRSDIASGKWNADPEAKLRRELWLARKELAQASRVLSAAQRAAIAAQEAARSARGSKRAAWCALIVSLLGISVAALI